MDHLLLCSKTDILTNIYLKIKEKKGDVFHRNILQPSVTLVLTDAGLANRGFTMKLKMRKLVQSSHS